MTAVNEGDQSAGIGAPGRRRTMAASHAARRVHLPVRHGSTEPSPRPNAADAARFVPVSYNRKLAPVERLPTGSRPRPRARGPFVSTTGVSIATTCSAACPFKGRGCFAEAGFTRFTARKFDAAARGLTVGQIIAEEVRLIDGAFDAGRIPQDGARGGHDLRLHVGGDVGSALGPQFLAGAAGRRRDRGGGAVWSFEAHGPAARRAREALAASGDKHDASPGDRSHAAHSTSPRRAP